ncbi:chloride conductance regulatory protein ICln [Cucurbita moschata]|uniref:Chloride conductance regulatory protein ICln n=1 Tax=Cucurbita moschata TaxID=3662 RepID=A0A6J1H3I6_CUCMO|nr:chloride conductance regulatory protein ICln [Cucurbita moschata]
MGIGLRAFTERTGDGLGLPVFDASQGEVLMHTVPAVAIVFDNRPPEFPGTLYVSSSQVVWLSDVDMAKGYAVDFLSMSLHAVSTDPEAYPSPCLYVQVDTGDEEESDNSDSECLGEESENLDLGAVREMRLVPSNPAELEALFDVCCQCAELNPDPTGDEEEEEHNWFFSADQLEEMPGLSGDGDDKEPFSSNPANSIGHSNGDHDQLSRTVLQLQINDQRFEDAEEMEPESNGKHHH